MNTPEPASAAPKRPAAKVRSNSLNYKDWIFRLIVFAVIVGSLVLSWWSLAERLGPVQKRSRELSSAVARLSANVDDLERKWNQAQAEELRRQLEQARDELFADESALQEWLASFRLQATPLALQAKADFGQPVEQSAGKAEKLAVIPATVSLDFLAPPAGQETAPPYARLLRLIHRLSDYDKRADLTGLNIEAGAGSINSAVLQFGLWAVEGDAR